MNLIPISTENSKVFEVFTQDYEAEFSSLTHKKPKSDGAFELDADWKSPNFGYFLYDNKTPAGFTVVQKIDGLWDIAEFYILPCSREKGLGTLFALEIFKIFKGPWQVRQIEGAEEARMF